MTWRLNIRDSVECLMTPFFVLVGTTIGNKKRVISTDNFSIRYSVHYDDKYIDHCE